MQHNPETLIAVFAKPPLPGQVKTRLIPALGAEGAAKLAQAFLLDTLDLVSALAWAQVVIATTSPNLDLQDHRFDDIPRWDQGDGDLGARMERVLRRALELGFSSAIALGADSPGLPREQLEQTRERLDASQAVLGPAEDGGYFLLGLRHCPPGLLADLPWSVSGTGAATVARLREHGFDVAMTDAFFDVDDVDDLEHLEKSLRRGDLTAPATQAALIELGRLRA